jgi:large subunit ribosomal protein L24
MQKIRKGDKVVVLAGKDKGRSGEVISVMPKDDKAVVRGINMVKRHQRQSQTQEAGIISKEAPIQLSNLGVADPKDGKPTRIGFLVKDGKKVRVAKRSGEVING